MDRNEFVAWVFGIGCALGLCVGVPLGALLQQIDTANRAAQQQHEAAKEDSPVGENRKPE